MPWNPVRGASYLFSVVVVAGTDLESQIHMAWHWKKISDKYSFNTEDALSAFKPNFRLVFLFCWEHHNMDAALKKKKERLKQHLVVFPP